MWDITFPSCVTLCPAVCTLQQTKGLFAVVKWPNAREIAYDIELDRNYGTKREK